MRLLLAALLCAPLATFAADPDDCEGCKDHPDVARFPGFVLYEAKFNDFNSYDFPAGPDDKIANREGRYWELAYQRKDSARLPSGVELVRNYENAFKKRGGKLQYQDMGPGGGQATFSMPLGKSERWFHLRSNNDHNSLTYVIVDVAAMEQKIEVTASEMLDALNANGFIALYGISFDTGKDGIKPESEPLLEEIAALLTQNGGLKLSVEGHTDNVGDKKANLALSKKRAESVKKWLVGKGVAAARLGTDGFGDGKPVADNRTDDGRAKNRRVELVKK